MGKVLPKSCPEKCGNVTISFPFGIGKHCYLDEAFEVECNKSSKPASLISNYFSLEITRIAVQQGYAVITYPPYPTCYNKTGDSADYLSNWYYLDKQYSVSLLKNKFVAIGCDVYAYIRGDAAVPNATGCASFCDKQVRSAPTHCETALPRTIKKFETGLYSVNTVNKTWTEVPCGFSFIVEKDFSQFDRFNRVPNNTSLLANGTYNSVPIPIVIDWAIGNNISCHEASKRKDYLCSQNAGCKDVNAAGGGYNCYCKDGYHGNPYLSNGCQDIDECKDPKKNNCKDIAICKNTPGSFDCTCPNGYYGVGYHDNQHEDHNQPKDVFRCVPVQRHHFSPRILLLGIGIAAVILILIALCFWLYRHLERKKKQKFFKKNGGLLLQQQISSTKGSVKNSKLFAAKELEKATDNFNQRRVLGKGGLGTVYKGMLQDGSIVAVKRSNMVNESQVHQFINEVSILLQIDHRNIVKLLGCCLETQVPLLVYEYVSNGTLSHHLHDEGSVSTISWENRLQIAKEVAGALAYLHSYASTSIFHRDVKSSNILLDENFRAVLCDFGLSRSISTEKTHLTTSVGGTFGYLDPAYFRSGQLTDKSDVYGFGVVLAELLTGVKAVCSDVSKLGLVMHFRASMKQNRLFEILDRVVVKEGLKEDILAVAKLAKRCLKLNVKKRPCMTEVAADLDRLTRKQLQPSDELISRHSSPSESECSNSYETDGITEDGSNATLVSQNRIG